MKYVVKLSYTVDYIEDDSILYFGGKWTSEEEVLNNIIKFLDTHNIDYSLPENEDSSITKIINYLLENNDIKYGRTGYSPWTHYITFDYMDYGYIQDLWEGYNHYDITLIDSVTGDMIDSICQCYILDDKELKTCILEHFGISEFYLVDNEASKYFHHDKKVKEVAKTTFNYISI